MFKGHETLMGRALAAARRAGMRDEVPVGAALRLSTGEIFSASNGVMRRRDPTAHAEILLIRKVIRRMGGIRLPAGCVLAVTVEPCLMCLTALLHARVAHVIYGCDEPKWGSSGRFAKLLAEKKFNHQFSITGGVRAEDAAAMMKDYFKRKRKGKK